MNYTVYGWAAGVEHAELHLGFTGHLLFRSFYLLGNGSRAYSTSLMRFVSSDRFSPFEIGGLNSYAYCECDPVNFFDPSGHGKMPVLRLARADRPNPPSNQMPVLTREPASYHRTESYKQWMREKQNAWTMKTDYAAKQKDRRNRTYKKVGFNDFWNIAEGAQPITRSERAELQDYVDSNRPLVGLSGSESNDLRGMVLDAMVSDQNQRLELGLVTGVIRGFFDRQPDRQKFTQGNLHTVEESVRGAIQRMRQRKS
ncbi:MULTISPECIES: RHS repeat-associated core domain-containing protein [Pseudomonas]|uniref:RHS repeat-associated core domain-containing protein n=1 Tax=Pseudomonas TaxID=286 RepID=UPI0013DEFC4D|nr:MULTISPECIES: RHS repeat-associated core domain-containing protein [Pseudomonas]MCE0912252.1 RHS repeat-associated core domain-containing protein [Pseudomonas kurunegalensis]QIG19621.1 RHS repeat-associated core domain-containing protein [Pseudomonas monteilii]QIG24875.1 RHS repeat-associated core domain-containing protein [Pseudomonas monteilii]WJR54327.1 RHS repeat-associated core domain-containing protein [Pseudomonas kurunegalensis]